MKKSKETMIDKNEAGFIPVLYGKKEAAEYLELIEEDIDYFTNEELLPWYSFFVGGEILYLEDDLDEFALKILLVIKDYMDFKLEQSNKNN